LDNKNLRAVSSYFRQKAQRGRKRKNPAAATRTKAAKSWSDEARELMDRYDSYETFPFAQRDLVRRLDDKPVEAISNYFTDRERNRNYGKHLTAEDKEVLAVYVRNPSPATLGSVCTETGMSESEVKRYAQNARRGSASPPSMPASNVVSRARQDLETDDIVMSRRFADDSSLSHDDGVDIDIDEQLSSQRHGLDETLFTSSEFADFEALCSKRNVDVASKVQLLYHEANISQQLDVDNFVRAYQVSSGEERQLFNVLTGRPHTLVVAEADLARLETDDEYVHEFAAMYCSSLTREAVVIIVDQCRRAEGLLRGLVVDSETKAKCLRSFITRSRDDAPICACASCGVKNFEVDEPNNRFTKLTLADLAILQLSDEDAADYEALSSSVRPFRSVFVYEQTGTCAHRRHYHLHPDLVRTPVRTVSDVCLDLEKRLNDPACVSRCGTQTSMFT